MNIPEGLVYIDDHGLIGSNFYWYKHEPNDLSKEDILASGLTSDKVQVSKELIMPLQKAEHDLTLAGFRLFVKEGYRSKVLYEIVYKRRVERFGKETMDRLLNMRDMPHATGLAVDLVLWSLVDKAEVCLRHKPDGVDALFINFYRDRVDEQSREYQRLQDLLIITMLKYGFRLGTKKEYFHFDYRPEMPPTMCNY